MTGSSDVGSPLDAVVRFLVSETAFVGIGPASAHRLRDGLGMTCRARCRRGRRNLATILGEGRAADLVSAWRERQGLADIVLWLAEAGFDRRLAGRVLALWGVGAARRLHGRPYDLMALAPWATVDRAARRMGVGRAPGAPGRLRRGGPLRALRGTPHLDPARRAARRGREAAGPGDERRGAGPGPRPFGKGGVRGRRRFFSPAART